MHGRLVFVRNHVVNNDNMIGCGKRRAGVTIDIESAIANAACSITKLTVMPFCSCSAQDTCHTGVAGRSLAGRSLNVTSFNALYVQ